MSGVETTVLKSKNVVIELVNTKNGLLYQSGETSIIIWVAFHVD